MSAFGVGLVFGLRVAWGVGVVIGCDTSPVYRYFVVGFCFPSYVCVPVVIRGGVSSGLDVLRVVVVPRCVFVAYGLLFSCRYVRCSYSI